MLLLVLTTTAIAAMTMLPVILVDNGSKRPSSTLALRDSASKLSRKLGGREVLPASLAYSDTIAADKLDGVRATTLSSSLAALAERGEKGAVVAPLFLGPSAGLARALAACKEEVASYSSFELHATACLVDDATEAHTADTRVAEALAEEVLAVASATGDEGATPPLPPPLNVVLVDHGTPSKKVNAVRKRLARQLDSVLGEKAATVQAASMERREGAEYDFNEPLLERALAAPPFNAGDVVLAMAFLLPGRHAGEGGDVMQIVDDAIAGATTGEQAALRVRATPPLASHPKVIEVLADRVLGVDASIAR